MNALRLSYKTQSVATVQRKIHSLLREPYQHVNARCRNNAEFLHVKPGGL